ncbi:glycosyltransferase family 4 protein [Halobacteriaceae archaeon GCM10025711]
MQVAFIHPNYPNSEGTGATHSATQIIELLEHQGHDVVPYCTSKPENGAIQCEVINSERVPPHTATILNKQILTRKKELEKFDIIHSYLPILVPAMNELANDTATVVSLNAYGSICPKNNLRYMGRKTCEKNGAIKCTMCSLATSGGNAEHGRLYRSLSRLGNLRLINQVSPENIRIDGFQALSTHVKETYSKFGYPEERIRVIPNILDEKFLVDHQTGFHEPYNLLYVGYLEEHKGVRLLPDIMKTLIEQSNYDFQMTIVGDGGLRRELERRAAEFNVEHAIDFRGRIKNRNLPQIYAHHDIFVYPGLWDEPFGRVFIESLAAGTPVIGTDVGAVKEIVGDAGEVTGSNPQALASAIEKAVGESMLSTYSAKAKIQAKKYLPGKVGCEFEKLYTDIA